MNSVQKKDIWVSKIALLWAGIVIGCAFIATPAKFMAPGLTISELLRVGHVQFNAMGASELVLVIIGGIILISMKKFKSLFWAAVLCYAIQWIVLMPLLNQETQAVIDGTKFNGPPWHNGYIILECIKVILLLILAFKSVPVRAAQEA